MKIFKEAARFGSFTAAADYLGLTQSAVSMSIKKIEERNNVILFERMGKGLVLTAAGEFLLREASRSLLNVELLCRRLRDYEEVSGEPTAVACSHHAYNFWMPGIILEPGRVFRASVDLMTGSAEDVTAWVMRGTVDVGLSELEPCHPLFKHVNVFDDRIILLAAPHQAKTLPEHMQLRDLEEHGPVIWAADDHDRVIGQALSEAGIDPTRLHQKGIRLRSVEAVLCALKYGRSIGFAPEAAASAAIAAGQLERVGDVEFSLKYYLFGKKGFDIANVARRISTVATEIAAERLVAPPRPVAVMNDPSIANDAGPGARAQGVIDSIDD